MHVSHQEYRDSSTIRIITSDGVAYAVTYQEYQDGVGPSPKGGGAWTHFKSATADNFPPLFTTSGTKLYLIVGGVTHSCVN